MDKPLLGMRALLAVPSYGPIDPACQKDLRVAMMVSANHGLSWAGDTSPDRMGYSAARNKVAQSTLEGGEDLSDGVLWVDSDIRMEPLAITSLLASVGQYKASFVTGVYHQRGGRHRPVFYEWQEKKHQFKSAIDYPENSFAPIGGCGFGFVWTGLDVIQTIAKSKWFNKHEGWFPDRRDVGGFGEDLSFCHHALRCGIQLYVNTAVQLGHTGDSEVITREDYLASKQSVESMDMKEEREVWG